MAVYLSHQSLAGWADSKTWREAAGVFQAGGIRDIRIEGNRVCAIVAVAGHPVHTRFQILPDGTVISDCPCFQNLRFNTVCAHVVAAGMAVADLTEDPQRERRRRIENRLRTDAAEGHHPIPRRASENTPGTIPASVRIRVPETWIEDLQDGAVLITCQIVVDGKKCAPDRIAPNRLLSFSNHDAYLLYVLEDFAQRNACPSALRLPTREFSQLINELTGGNLWITGRQAAFEVAAEPAISIIQFTLGKSTGMLTVKHRTEPEGRIILVSDRSGWVLTESSLHPLESILPSSLRAAYSDPLSIERAHLFKTLNGIVPSLENDFIVENNVDPDGFEFTEGVPTFEVHIQGASDRAFVSLYAVYGTCCFNTAIPPDPTDMAPVEGEPLHYITRNSELEQQARSLFASSFEEGAEEDGHILLQGSAGVVHVMADIAPAFERLGWRVRYGDGVASLAQAALWVRPCITITAGGGHEDRIDIRYTDEHDIPVHTDTVENAIRASQAVISDADRTLLLDVSGLNSLAAALAECIEYKEGVPCVERIHAGFVRAIVTRFATARLTAPDDWMAHAVAQQEKSNLPTAPIHEALFKQLRPYQREGVNWLSFLDHSGYCGILADEMGLGKTVQALAWIQIRRNAFRLTGKVTPAIVVCPTSLIHNWAREVERFAPDLTYTVITGNARQRLHEHIQDYDLVITSYALLRRDIDVYDSCCFSAVILDEAQHIKNRSTQNAVAAKRLKGLRRLVLTGTPIENSVNDLWSIMDFLMPGYLGTHTSFRIRFEQPITVGSLNADRALERLRLKMEPFMLRRLKITVAADLPEKVTRIADCPMLPAQRRLYRQLLARYHDNLSALVDEQGFERARFSVFSALLRLRQCCCHPALLKNIDGAAEAASGKMDLFFELLDEALDGGHRVLVFSQFVQMLHILRDALKKRDIPYAYLDGSTRDRMAQVDAFNNNPAIPVFLVSLKAGGSGLNLTGANVVIHYDPWWNPAVEDQATDRTHRIGQTRTVYSIKLVTENSIEQKVIELQRRKRVLISAAIGTATSIEHALTWEDVRELLRMPDE